MLKTRAGRAWVTAFAVLVILAVGVVLLINRGDGDRGVRTPDTGAVQVVRDSSHRLNAPRDATVTFVEFLDFECEGCRAAYPIVEQLRADYGDRVEFVLRYFPLSGHFNGERAARAVEAAAQQGQLEAMYRKMFDTQAEWGEQRTPADHIFRGFAGDLGLDMAAFDAAYNDPATLERIRVDQRDGEALGVMGTPTFFVNGEQIPVQRSDDLRNAIDSALG
ncbi:DsbA family protein [Mycolicibacterium sp. P9-22]|uniref:DsbA family protein n=1 Tax=Mycolicibacterium sp. P9-22 TaxID=2024613 RepID=UPI0011ECE0E5|nr:thioredoxin domain-containing protein [Mycolicibacterium sp. P9-22]KAA0113335.1 thioredoxin [Mycolicibacterium sp. P9-22]